MSPCRQAKMIGFNEGGDSAVRYHRKPASALTHEIDFPCPHPFASFWPKDGTARTTLTRQRTSRDGRRSPDAARVHRNHGLPLLAAESLSEFIEVLHRSVHTPLTWGVRIRKCRLPRGLLGLV